MINKVFSLKVSDELTLNIEICTWWDYDMGTWIGWCNKIIPCDLMIKARVKNECEVAVGSAKGTCNAGSIVFQVVMECFDGLVGTFSNDFGWCSMFECVSAFFNSLRCQSHGKVKPMIRVGR